MATSKKRRIISLPDDVDKALLELADRDQLPPATKAVDLIRIAIQIDEDDIWNNIAENRDTKSAKFISHDDAWA